MPYRSVLLRGNDGTGVFVSQKKNRFGV